MALRDSSITPRAVIFAVFAAFGTVVGGVAGAVPVILRNAGLGTYEYGVAATLSMLATVAAMALGTVVSRHASNRAVMLWSIPAAAAAVLTLFTANAPAAYFASVTALGFALGATDLFMNAEGAEIEHDLGRPVLTAFHGAVSATIPVFALSGSWLANTAGPGAVAGLVALCLAAAWVFVWRYLPVRRRAAAQVRARVAITLPLILIGAISGLTNASEICVITWASKLLDEMAPDLAAIAGLGAAFYGACNAIMRFCGDALRARFHDVPVLIASIAVSMAGFALLGLTTSFAGSVAAFAVVGFGVALLTPCAFALAAAQAPHNRAAALGFISAVAGPPRILAPIVFGWIASGSGIGATFGLVTVILLAALICTVILRGLSLARAGT